MIKINEPVFALKLFAPDNTALLFETNDKIIQLFVNFLSSAFSLIDHSRKYIKTYDNTSLHSKYIEKKEMHFDNNVCAFINDLRQYSIHYKLPIVSQNLSFSNNPNSLRNEAMLNIDDLLDSDYTWKSRSREYFKHRQTSLISVHVLANEYFSLVKKIYLWFFNEITEYHKEDFNNLNGYKTE